MFLCRRLKVWRLCLFIELQIKYPQEKVSLMKKHMPFIWLPLQSAFKTLQESPPWATACWLPAPQSQHEDNTHHVFPFPLLIKSIRAWKQWGGGVDLSRWFPRTTESSVQKEMEQYFPAQDLTWVCFLPNLCACWHHFLLNTKSLWVCFALDRRAHLGLHAHAKIKVRLLSPL